MWSQRAERRRIWLSGGASSISGLCTSCHDGFIAESCGSGSSGLGTGPHPVGVRYSGPATPADGDGVGPPPGEEEDGATRRNESVTLPLYDRRVECTTCHWVHRGPAYVPALRLEHKGGLRKSELCRRCHGAEPEPTRFFPGGLETPRIQHLVSYAGKSDASCPQDAVVLTASDIPLGGTELGAPYGLLLRDGNLLLCDGRGGGVVAFDLATGSFESRRGGDVLQHPVNLVLDATGDLLVADAAHGVQAIDGKGRLRRILGPSGGESLHGLAVSDERVFVSEPGAHRIDVHDHETGDRRESFELALNDNAVVTTTPGWPTDLAVDAEGNLLVTDAAFGQVQRFSPSGDCLQVFGHGYLGKPRGIACDRDGRTYVVDIAHAEVLIIDKEGELLLAFGQPDEGEKGRLHRPAQVTIDYDHSKLFQDRVAPGYEIEYLVAVTDQMGPRLVQIYAFLKPSSGVHGPPTATAHAETPAIVSRPSKTHSSSAGSSHPLFRGKKCETCHVKEADGRADVASCISCHRDWDRRPADHRKSKQCRPVAEADCLACHDPHESPEKALLLAPLEKLCTRCHER